ncbi:MAG: LamG-like jellyroll fold domain-containing protein [Opitutaceae bacterium]
MKIPLFLVFILLLPSALSAQSLLLEYTFNESEPRYLSTGEIPVTLSSRGALQSAGAPGSGVSGNYSDRAWDASANTTQGIGLPANTSALVSPAKQLDFSMLQAFTITFWYKTQHPFTDDAATRFIMKSERPSEPIGQGLMLRSYKGALELRLGAVQPGNDGQLSEVVANSTRFPANSGYNRTDIWIFAAITWNGKNIRFHVGDSKLPVSDAGGSPFAGSIVDAPGLLAIGNARSFNRGLDGWLDNFRLYGTALSNASLESIRRSDLQPR